METPAFSRLEVTSPSGGPTLTGFHHPAAGPVRGQLLIVHGFQEHSDRYLEVASHCAARGLGVTRFDLRGHGRSPGRRGDVESFDHFLEDLDAAWSALPPVGARFLLGHSLGGLIALRWAQTRSESLSGLVVSAPWLGTALQMGAAKRAARVLLERLAPGLAIPQPLDPSALTRDPERQAAHRSDPLKHERVTARLVSGVEKAQRTVLAEALVTDSLFIIPEADPIADARVSLAFVAGLDPLPDLLRYPVGRHEPFQDNDRDEVTGRMVEWVLNRCP